MLSYRRWAINTFESATASSYTDVIIGMTSIKSIQQTEEIKQVLRQTSTEPTQRAHTHTHTLTYKQLDG